MHIHRTSIIRIASSLPKGSAERTNLLKVLASEDDPVFLDYQDALDWIDLKSKEYGGKRLFTSTPLFHRVSPTINALYKAQKAKSDAKIQQEFVRSGLQIGDNVELRSVGAFLTLVHLMGKIVSRGEVPYVQIDPNPFTARRLMRWDSRWGRTNK